MRPFTWLVVVLIFLFGLPPFGLFLTGYSLPPNLTLLPISIEPGEASISWLTVCLLATFILATLLPVFFQYYRFKHTTTRKSFHPIDLPWWGWLAILWVAGSWILAWTRFSWFEPWQAHTFPLFWIGYIVTLNALTNQRAGQCMLTHQPQILCRLFLLSAGFWWAFEYLNQYVNNWHYVNVPATSHFAYFLYTSISFSTVLPAVLSTYEWLNTFPRLTKPFEHWHTIPWMSTQETGWIFFGLGTSGLVFIGVWPTILFPLLWLSPLGLLLAIPFFQKQETCFRALIQGDWRPVILSALAALFCGFWWELWNAYSLVHWEYTIPYVHAFKFFEMPLLGYAGYLPFGLICLAITEFWLGYSLGHQKC